MRELGLGSYRWLPQSLCFEFGRAFGVPVQVTLPEDGPGDAWAERGRAPKNGPTHSEDLEQGVVWFYAGATWKTNSYGVEGVWPRKMSLKVFSTKEEDTTRSNEVWTARSC